MTACTERHPARANDGVAGEGQKGMPKEAAGMTACTERHPARANDGVAGEGQKGMPKEAQT
jgi:hypothetical protein